MKKKFAQVKVLLDSLPYIQRYTDAVFVIKYGGSAQINPDLKQKFARDIVLMYMLGIKPVIVHGGGKRISELLDAIGEESRFIDGLRVTDARAMEVVEMVLCGSINKEITTLLTAHGAKALGISGKDAGFIRAHAVNWEKYGYVGEISSIDDTVVKKLIAEKFIPVIAPVGIGEEENHPGYNINADTAAAAIAATLGARKIIFMTDTPGVLDKEKNLLQTLTAEQIRQLIENKTIEGGMIPKVQGCLRAVEHGVPKAHIIDGRIEHALLLEVFTSKGIGTVIR